MKKDKKKEKESKYNPKHSKNREKGRIRGQTNAEALVCVSANKKMWQLPKIRIRIGNKLRYIKQ